MGRGIAALLIAMACALGVQPAVAQPVESRPSGADSFAIGTGGTVCQAQGISLRGERGSVYDRRWALLCRDVARPVGTALALKRGDNGFNRLERLREEPLSCQPATAVALSAGYQAEVRECRGQRTGIAYRSYRLDAGRRSYFVEGVAGYDSALRLALWSLAEDRVVSGAVEVATLGGGDAASLLQAQAKVSDPEQLIGEGYRRNNAGAYAEAAELFQNAVLDRPDADKALDPVERARRAHEVAINRALQLSNLDQYDQAATLFAQAAGMAGRDPIQTRLGRNFEAIDAINRGNLDLALAILARPMPPLVAAPIGTGASITIDRATAADLNAGKPGELAGILGQEVRLSVSERVTIIDAQAGALRGTILRLQGKLPDARAALSAADAAALRIRDGRVVSITRLRSQILSEQALALEAGANFGAAEGLLRQALALVETQYPDSASLNGARARLAGFLVRRARQDEALAIYRTVIRSVVGNRGALVGMANLIRPYFDLLIAGDGTDPGRVADLLLAAQLVERPGAADTLAQLSRQLEAGNGPAAGLFRQSVAVARDLERNRILVAQATAAAAVSKGTDALVDLQAQQQRLLAAQLKVMEALSGYPQFRAVTHTYVTLDELRATLAPGEAYLKLTRLGDRVYGVYADRTTARGWRLGPNTGAIGDLVGALRDSISVTVNGVRQTTPFDVDDAVALSDAVIGPVRHELGPITHLIFEPDAAMLQLPPNLLVLDPIGVKTYHDRVARGDDEFDFRGIDWLGRDRAISTALSAATFRDARRAPSSTAAHAYLGLGENRVLGPVSAIPVDRSAVGVVPAGCEWPAAAWNHPIAATELNQAAALFGAANAQVLTQGAFTDTAIQTKPDLDAYRIVHFATHGLVTAPRDGCPARPALLTSFGGKGSDGLLRFDEIFNLHFDADLIVLSACDTAGAASLEATREAGITNGGGQALDGLIRAFIAAGARQVIASHWPAPDDYHATERLMGAFFGAPPGISQGAALMVAERRLMDDPETSHPFYWAGFALIGDGARLVVAAR